MHVDEAPVPERPVHASRLSTEHEMIAGVSRLFLTTTTLDQVFGGLAQLLAERVGFGRVGIALLDELGSHLRWVAVAGGDSPESLPREVPVEGTVTGTVATTGRSCVELDVQSRDEPHFAAIRALGAASFACVPLRGAHGVLGVLMLHSDEPRPEMALVADVLDVVAGSLALEIERKRSAVALAKSESKYREFLEHFHGVAYRWAPQAREVNVVEGAVEKITGHTADTFRSGALQWFDIVHPDDLPIAQRAEEAMLARPDFVLDIEYRIVRRDGGVRWVNDVARRMNDDGDGTVVVQGAVYDITVQKEAQARLLASEEKLRRVFNSTHDAIVVHDARGRVLEVNETWLKMYDVNADEALTYSVSDYSAPDGTMLARLPSLWQKTLAGEPQIFEWTARRPHDGSLFDVEVFLCPMTIASETVVLGNVRDVTVRRAAESSALEAAARLRRTVEGAVSAMGALVETRDPYTAGHERRVTRLAVAIAAELGVGAEELETIRVAGEVHDIGKVAVPAEILTKPGRLQETEFAIIQVHPGVGADILSQVEFGAPVADIVRWHHERLDGSGYPDGLKDGDIPLTARVIAVADVVEAMASHRPYRPALGIEVALAEIRQNAGRLYDSDVVAACERVFAAGFELAEQS